MMERSDQSPNRVDWELDQFDTDWFDTSVKLNLKNPIFLAHCVAHQNIECVIIDKNIKLWLKFPNAYA